MPPAEDAILAAQYLRMSTEHQKYSIERQAQQIDAYANARGYDVVATFRDEGKSGLSLKGRPALRDLIKRVVSGKAAFSRILVLDVSRWGRFQNPDEAAHLEFICREAGIPVEYVAEPFNDWTGAAASIVKSIKRIMAAEYSRELSFRVKAAQVMHAQQGFKQGGRATFGVRRRVIAFDGSPRQKLETGERKSLSSDRVRLIRGPARERLIVQRIFNEFAVQGFTITKIARRLNEQDGDGTVWTRRRVAAILDSPHAQGVYRYNVHSSRLGAMRRRNPESEWIESNFAPPLLPGEVHAIAFTKRQARRQRRWTDEAIVEGLKALVERDGKVTSAAIKASGELPSLHTCIKRFGSLAAAYEIAGYTPPAKPVRALPPTSNDELLAGLKRLMQTHGRISGELIEADPTLPSLRTVKRRFGSLDAALEWAGYGLAERARHMQQRIRKRRPEAISRRISDEALIEPLRQLYARHGYLSAKLIDGDDNCACMPTYVGRFGSIIVAYRLAGWNVTRGEVHAASLRRQRRHNAPIGGWSRASLEDALRSALKRHGRLTVDIVTADPELPSASTVAKIFGGMREAYAAIGFEPRDD